MHLGDLGVPGFLQRRDLRRREAARAAADHAALKRRDTRAVALERKRNADTRDAATDHRRVELQVASSAGDAVGGAIASHRESVE